MSQWNLSVRLTGEGSDLASSLRDSAKEAGKLRDRIDEAKHALTELRAAAANDIKVRLDIDADHLRNDVTSALTTAGSGQALAVRLDLDAAHLRDEVSAALTGASAGQDLGIRLGIDAAHLRTDVTDALTSAGTGQGISVRLDVDTAHLRDDVSAALTSAGAGQGMSVDLRLGNAMQLRRDVSDAVRWAAWGQRIEIPLVLADRMQLRRDVSAAVRWASDNQVIRVRVEPDTTALNNLPTTAPGNNNRRPGGGGGGNSGGGAFEDFGLVGLIPLATAAIPLVGGLMSTLAPAAGMFAATGGAATAFGIAIAGQIGPLTEAADAEKKYQEAVAEHGRGSAEAAQAQLTYQRTLAAMPPQTQRAAIALSSLKTTFGDWSDDMAQFTMAPVEKGFTVLEQVIPALTPEVESFSSQMDRLMNVAGGAVSTPAFDQLVDKTGDLVDTQLDSFTDQVIHLLRVVSEGNVGGGAIGQILAYFRESGPAAREAVEAIGDAVSTLAQGAAQAGPTMLTLVTAAARLVAAMPPELVAIILQVVAALKLLQLAGAGAAAAAVGITRVRTAITGLVAASAAAGGGLAGLRAAFMSLGVAARASIIVAGIAAVVLVLKNLSDIGKQAPPDVEKLTTSLGKLGQTGKVTGEAARAFGKDFQGLGDSLRTLSRPSNLDKTQQFLTKLVGMDSTPVKEAKEDLDAVDQSLANLVKSGKADIAEAAFDRIAAAMRKQGMSGKELRSNLDAYKSALADQAFEQELAAQSMGLFGQAAQDTSAKLAAQKASADGLRQSLVALNDVNRAGASAMSAFEQSLDDVTKAAKSHSEALKMRDGELDLGTTKAREAEKTLSDLAANTDAAATAARDQGKSWEYVNGIYSRGRQAFIEAADAMGLTRSQAEALADSYLKIPDKKSMTFEMRTEDAIAGLNSVISAIKQTPDAKSVTVKALTNDAVALLESLGFKVKELKDGRFQIIAQTGTAEDHLGEVRRLRDGLKDKSIKVSALTSQTVTQLQQVQDKIRATKGKTVTMGALTGAARAQLEALGFKIKNTKGKTVTISVPTGSAKAGVDALRGAISALHSRTVTITTQFVNKGKQQPGPYASGYKFKADGGVTDYYANGGLNRGSVQRGGVRHFAGGSEQHVAQIAPAGSWRVWGEPETGGEAYIPLAPWKRRRSKKIAEETVRRLGGKGIAWNADGSVLDQPGVQSFASGGFTYNPDTPVLGGLSDPKERVDKLVASLRDAWKQYDDAVKDLAKAKGSKAKAAARRKVTKERADIAEINASLGQSKYAKAPTTFDLSNYMKQLDKSVAATQKWRSSLTKIASRGGQDVADLLESMGEDGYSLVNRLATASKSHFNEIVADLQKVAGAAKATLADYTKQLNATNKVDAAFQKNLITLAGQGYGALASQLAGQNDKAAQEVAADAVKSKSAAATANAAAKTQANQLSSDELTNLVQIIAAITKSSTGIHDVAATTGLGEDDIITIANKASSQIKASLGDRSTQFLADLARANQHLSYANGGIRSGIYATKAGAVTFAEPSTGGEAYIPLGANKRGSATAVLGDVAGRFGLGLTDARSGRPVVNNYYNTSQSVTSNLSGVGNPEQVARRIDSSNAYQLRRLARGGVAAR